MKTETTKKILWLVVVVMVVVCGCFLVSHKLLGAWQLKSVRVLGWEGDHHLLMAGMIGVVRWDVNQQMIVNRSFRPDGINHFFTSSEGQVWAYGDGLWLFDSGIWIEMDEAAGLQRGLVHDMGQTTNGTVWVAAWYGFKFWNQETGLWESMLVDRPGETLVQGSDGSLWFGLVEDGVIRLQSGEFIHWTTADGLIDNRTKSMLVASDGTIWVGTHRGVSRWDQNGWQSWEHLGYPDPDGLVVYEFYETSDGTIWAATSEDLAKWDGQEWTTYQRSPSCFTVFTLLEADDGSFWVGCSGGVFRWAGDDWREYGTEEGLRDNSWSYLVEGTNGIVYAKTKSGIYEYVTELDHWQRLSISR